MSASRLNVYREQGNSDKNKSKCSTGNSISLHHYTVLYSIVLYCTVLLITLVLENI